MKKVTIHYFGNTLLYLGLTEKEGLTVARSVCTKRVYYNYETRPLGNPESPFNLKEKSKPVCVDGLRFAKVPLLSAKKSDHIYCEAVRVIFVRELVLGVVG